MAATDETDTGPTPEQIKTLKGLAAGIIRQQGNRFIKELLREKGIRIGANKDEFERNLIAAIESGELDLGDFDGWLKQVEGWGNQHVYLYKISPKLRKELTPAAIRERLDRAGLGKLWDAPTVLEFPDEPRLTSVSFTGRVLQLVWQEGSPGWIPIPEKNFRQEEGLDTFEYRAWRKIERRAISRFEARLDLKLAALFIAYPIQGEEHENAVAEAMSAIEKLMDRSALEAGLFSIGTVSRNLDQQNIPSNVDPHPKVRTQRSRLASGGSYVEFAANSREKAYWDAPAIQELRKAVRPHQLVEFSGTEGVFVFQPGTGPDDLSRPLRVQLYGKDRRIRLWAQMDVREVWTILTWLSRFQ